MEKHELGVETLWVFVSCSKEARHLHDIVVAVDVLRGRGVADSDILVFVDHDAPEPHLKPFSIGNVYPVLEIGSRLSQAAPHASVVVTVTGHGSLTGLGDGQLTPVGLCEAVRSVPGAALCVLVLGQCFAGIFNYVDAQKEPPLVLIGATNLNLSLSTGLTLQRPVMQSDGTAGLATWSANLFTLFFFSWVRRPVDIDGDGDVNLLDAYRYAGAVSNERLRKLKVSLFREADGLVRRLAQAEAQGPTPEQTDVERLLHQLGIQAIQTELGKTLENLYLHQEPWILNAHLARKVHFSGFTQSAV